MEVAEQRVVGYYLDADGIVVLLPDGEVHLGLAEVDAFIDALEGQSGPLSASRRRRGRTRCDRGLERRLRGREPRDLCTWP